MQKHLIHDVKCDNGMDEIRNLISVFRGLINIVQFETFSYLCVS